MRPPPPLPRPPFSRLAPETTGLGVEGRGRGWDSAASAATLPRPLVVLPQGQPFLSCSRCQSKPTHSHHGWWSGRGPSRMPAGSGFSSPLPSRAPECVGGMDTSRLLGRGGWMGWARARLSSTLRWAECDPDRNAVFRSQYWHRSQGRARPWGLGLPGAEAGPQPMEDGGAASPRTRGASGLVWPCLLRDAVVTWGPENT